jgi:hypothetical protein
MSRSAIVPFLFAAALALPGQVEAQFGLAAGPTLADLIGSDVQSSDSRSGLTAGGSYTLFNLGPVAIGPELFYAPKGAAETQLLVESPEFFQEVGLDYVEIPVLGHLTFAVPGLEDRLWASVTGGPAFAWKLNCSIQMTETGGAGSARTASWHP